MSSLPSPADNVLGTTDDTPMTMDVSSSVLEPIIITDTQARFVLENKGILSRDSVLQFQMIVPLANSPGAIPSAGKAFLPMSAGIFSLIRSATLRVGARRISDINDLGVYKAMAHSYDTPSFRNNKTRLLKGINTVLNPTPVAPTDVSAGMFSPAGSQVAGEGDVWNDYQMLLHEEAETTPCWSIKLVDLFPILWDIELPLFLLEEQVAIELHFNTQTGEDKSAGGVGTLCCFESVGGAPPANMTLAKCELWKPSCLLYLDTLYYSNVRMEEIAERVNATKGQFLDYSDLIQNVANMPAVAGADMPSGGTTNLIRQKVDQIPLSGFVVKNLYYGYLVNDYSSANTAGAGVPLSYRYYNQLLGKYALVAFRQDDTVDIRVNDLLLYPEPITSSTHKATEAEACQGGPVWLNQGVWSYNPSATKSGLFPVDPQASLFPDTTGGFKLFGGHMDTRAGLEGAQSFVGINLSNSYGNQGNDGVLISQKPVEVLHSNLSYAPDNNYQRSTYYYAEVVRRFGILDGRVQIFQGPAVDTRT